MKQAVAIIIILFLCVLGGMAWYFFTQEPPSAPTQNYNPTDSNTFFPYDGQLNNNVTVIDPGYGYDIPTTPPTTPNVRIAERLFQISLEPVAGYSAFNQISTSTKEGNSVDREGRLTQLYTYSTSSVDLVRFVERAKGHLYDANIATTNYNLTQERSGENVAESVLITAETTIPKVNRNRVVDVTSLQPIYYAWPATNAIQTVMQALDTDLETVQTRLVKISPSDAVTAIDDEQDIAAVAAPKVERIAYPNNTQTVAYNGDKVFYLTKETGGARGYIATSLERKSPELVFSSVLSDFNVSWPGGDWLALTTKSHSRFVGMTYLINWRTGVEKHPLSNIRGLTAATNYDGSFLLYTSNPSNLELTARSMGDYSDVRLPIYTLPEKCAWSKINTEIAYCAVPYFIDQSYSYPEHWYQGQVDFIDVLWQVNVATGQARIVYDPVSQKQFGFDMIEVKLNEDEQFFYFQDKTTLTLWGIWVLDEEEILQRTG